MKAPMLMLLAAVCAFGQGEIPTEKQATNVGGWTSVTVTPAQTLKTTWNFESFYTTCGPKFRPKSVSSPRDRPSGGIPGTDSQARGRLLR